MLLELEASLAINYFWISLLPKVLGGCTTYLEVTIGFFAISWMFLLFGAIMMFWNLDYLSTLVIGKTEWLFTLFKGCGLSFERPCFKTVLETNEEAY